MKSRYFCYRKHRERYIGRHTIYASIPERKEYLTLDEWIKQGCPKDDSIHFLEVAKGGKVKCLIVGFLK